MVINILDIVFVSSQGKCEVRAELLQFDSNKYIIAHSNENYQRIISKQAKTFEICEKCRLKKILYFARKIFESFVIFPEIVLDNLGKECYIN